MKDGVRVINCARGELLVDEALKDALDSGKVAGAALDVFPAEPITDYPLFDGYANVVVTPHLGASTTEAQDRAGDPDRRAGRRRAHRRRRLDRGQHPRRLARRTWRCSGPTCRSCSASAASPSRSPTASIERVECEYLGHLAGRDTRLLTLATLNGVLAGHTEEEVNLVNAPSLAEERGIEVAETKELVARDFTDLVRITRRAAARVVGTTLGQLHRPHLLEAWGQRFNLQLDDAHFALFRYSDLPGMVGRVGTAFGEHGINISQAAVGRQPPGEDGHRDNVAVMAVTADAAGAAGARRRDRRDRRLHRRPRRLALSLSRPSAAARTRSA